jgi:hypothetical protein
LGGETMGAPVAEGVPATAKELWVVSHEYLLNGSPVPCNVRRQQAGRLVNYRSYVVNE